MDLFAGESTPVKVGYL